MSGIDTIPIHWPAHAGYRLSPFAGMLVLFLLGTIEAKAELMFSPRAHVGVLSPRPIEDEPTPNVYPYEVELLVGYSWNSRFDWSLKGGYSWNLQSPRLTDPMLGSTVDVGSEAAWRIAGNFYLGFGGQYRWLSYGNSEDLLELSGLWRGICGYAAIGAVFPSRRSAGGSAWQVLITAAQCNLKHSGQVDESSLNFDQLKVGLSYHFHEQVELKAFQKFFKNVFGKK